MENDRSSTQTFQADENILIKRFNDAILEAKGGTALAIDSKCDANNDLLPSESQSRTVEVQLDDDPEYYMRNPYSASDDLNLEIFDFYDPPPAPTDVRPRVPPGLTISNLSQFAVRQFEIFLDPPSLGTMCNWEYLAARLGLAASEIMYLRTQKRPTAEVLHKFSSRSLDDLLDIICDLGRIDLLLSLREYVSEGNFAVASTRQPTDSGVAESTIPLISTSNISMDDSDHALLNSVNNPDREKCILVVHHENKENFQLRKNYAWFAKNLRKYATRENFKLRDVDNCVDDANLIGTINNLFANAKHIIFVFSEDLLHLLYSSMEHSLKKYVFDLSNTEYARTLRNMRFRPVVFKDEKIALPVGWPNNTIVYEFPTMFDSLCSRIFR
uniref:Myeloid differentiation primary response protein MyD88 n=1 Tax=Syphacia muris TaxID=451379 RepID=A0A0N5AHR9_9BILA